MLIQLVKVIIKRIKGRKNIGVGTCPRCGKVEGLELYESRNKGEAVFGCTVCKARVIVKSTGERVEYRPRWRAVCELRVDGFGRGEVEVTAGSFDEIIQHVIDIDRAVVRVANAYCGPIFYIWSDNDNMWSRVEA